MLEGKSLILEALDLVVNLRELPPAQGALVNLRDLPPAQVALFYCKGANLTVRNCTITLGNSTAQPFVLVHAEGTAGRGSRILFEKTFVRGAMASAFDLAGGAVDIATRETIIVGSQGPLCASLNQITEASNNWHPLVASSPAAGLRCSYVISLTARAPLRPCTCRPSLGPGI